MPSRDLSKPILLAVCAALTAAAESAQIPGRNVNMVAGMKWPGGDPFLQRQNEPSIAVSTRNPLHLLAGANDYRTVDLPGGPPPPEGKMVGDAWLGVFKSFDGGSTWRSTLLPGYPQDNSPQGLASPAKGFDFAADPTVRAGTNGLFYYSGIAADRGEHEPGVLFLARFIDNNNKENGDPIEYLGTILVDNGSAGRFIDKPWLAVDRPRAGAKTCTVGSQSFAGGNVYLAYAVFVGNDINVRTKVYFARSTDCGLTWTRQKLSEGYPVNQGTTIGIDPTTGAVYVAWRQFKTDQVPDAILMAKSVDGGQTFTKAFQVATINPFQQGTSNVSFRTNAFPSIAVDDSSRVYLAWSERGMGPGGDARVVVSVSTDGGTTWSAPSPVDNPAVCSDLTNADCRGHQFMPSITFAGGKVVVVYYALLLDHTFGVLTPGPGGVFDETRQAAGDLAGGVPEKVFTDVVADVAPSGFGPLKRRHTIDVRAVQAAPAAAPAFGPPVRVSQYLFGNAPFEDTIRQLKFNPPNLPMFALGTSAFIGDYIDIAGTQFRPVPGTSQWEFNASAVAPVFHATWTDNRDVRPPADGNWANYVPAGSTGGPSLYDPSQNVPACTPATGGQTGMRNQNIYTARLTQGLFVGSPGNAKPLGQTTFPDGTTGLYQRAFVVFVQNATDELKSYRLTIANQPPGGKASFLQFSPVAVEQLDVDIAPRSSISRTVFVTSSDPDASVTVEVQQITASGPGGVPIPPASGGLQASVVLNPDITNPDITNPDITNPDITNPDITNAEVYNPDITNPDITNPDITNPDITNPDITNPDITNGAVTDATWTITNTGNATAAYSVKLLLSGGPLPPGFKKQLILHRIYTTPVAVECELKLQTQNVLIANIVNPVFVTDPAALDDLDLTDPDVTNATMLLAPGDTGRITLRIVDPDRFDAVTFDPASAVSPAVQPQAVNTEDALAGVTVPPVVVALTITTAALPGAVSYSPYSATVQATGGQGAYAWSVSAGSLPPGLTLNPATGLISGTPTSTGTFTFTVQVQDSGVPQHADTQDLSIVVAPSIAITTASPLPDGVVGAAYSQTLTASGGNGSYSWSLAPGSGPLPPGLSLSSAGVISGTPTASGTFNFTARVTDTSTPPETADKAFSLRIFPVSLAGVGTATIDGVLSPGEWDSAGQVNLDVNVPGGGTTPATLFVMNDSSNLYVAIRFARDAFEAGHFTLEFDNNNDGTAQNGEDTFLFSNQFGFDDAFRTNAPPCPPGNPEAFCTTDDVSAGGTEDGAGAFVNSGGFSVYEMSHPLNSGDAGHDFALAPGQAVGFFMALHMIGAGNAIGHTDYPGFRNYGRIIAAVGGQVTDPSGDATPSSVTPSPDLIKGWAKVVEGNLTLRVRFAPGTFASQTTALQFLLDTDENASTGHPGSDSGGVNDNGIIGVEYLVEMGSAFNGNQAKIMQYAGTPNSFTQAGTATAAFVTDGMEVTIPLSLIGNDDGKMKFKVVTFAQIAPSGFTGVLDYMTNVGSPPGTTQ